MKANNDSMNKKNWAILKTNVLVNESLTYPA